MLDWNPKTRFDIDQVVNSRAIKKFQSRFKDPLTPEEYEMLIKNFLMNSPTGLTSDTPRDVLKYACFEPPSEDWINLQESFQNTGYILNKRKNNFESFEPSPRDGNGKTFQNLQGFGRGDIEKAQAQTWNDFMPPAMVSDSSPRQLGQQGKTGVQPMQKQDSFAKQPENPNRKVIKIDNGGDNIWGPSPKEAPQAEKKPQNQSQGQASAQVKPQGQSQGQAQTQAKPQGQAQASQQASLLTQSQISPQAQSQSLYFVESHRVAIGEAPSQPKGLSSVPHQSPQPPQSPTLWKTPYAPNLPTHHFGYFESNSLTGSASTTPSTPFGAKDLEPKIKKIPNSEPPVAVNPFIADPSPRNNLNVSQASRTATDQNWDVSQAFKKVQKLDTPEPKRFGLNKHLDAYQTAPQPQPKAEEPPRQQKDPETTSNQSSGVKFVKRVFATGSFVQPSSQTPNNIWESTSARQSPKRQASNPDARSDISVKDFASNPQGSAHSSASDSLSINTNAGEQLNLTGVTSPNSKGLNRHKIDLDQKVDITRTVGAVTQPKEEVKAPAINRTTANQPMVYRNGVLLNKNGAANGSLTADIQVTEINKPKSDELLESKRVPEPQSNYPASVQSLEQYKNKFIGLAQQGQTQTQTQSLQVSRIEAPNFGIQVSGGSSVEETISPMRSPRNDDAGKPSNKMFKINLSIHGQQRDPPVVDAKPEPKSGTLQDKPKQVDIRGQAVGDQSSRGYTSIYGSQKPQVEAPTPERNGQGKSNVKHFKID